MQSFTVIHCSMMGSFMLVAKNGVVWKGLADMKEEFCDAQVRTESTKP